MEKLKNLSLELFTLNREKEAIENRIAELKKQIEEVLPADGYKDEIVTISRVAESSTTSIDLKSFKEKEPTLYEELIADYSKTTTKKASVSYRFAKK